VAQLLVDLLAPPAVRSAMATAAWRRSGVMCRSSSDTISCGVIASFQHLDRVMHVRVDAQLAGDLERLLTMSRAPSRSSPSRAGRGWA